MNECHDWLFTFAGMIGAWIGMWGSRWLVVHNQEKETVTK